jgi:hypothetical protein
VALTVTSPDAARVVHDWRDRDDRRLPVSSSTSVGYNVAATPPAPGADVDIHGRLIGRMPQGWAMAGQSSPHPDDPVRRGPQRGQSDAKPAVQPGLTGRLRGQLASTTNNSAPRFAWWRYQNAQNLPPGNSAGRAARIAKVRNGVTVLVRQHRERRGERLLHVSAKPAYHLTLHINGSLRSPRWTRLTTGDGLCWPQDRLASRRQLRALLQ